MIDKKTLLFAVVISFLSASENPFSVAQNMQKIEEDENQFLKALGKSKKISGKKKEIKPVQTAPNEELNASNSKRVETPVSSQEKNHKVRTPVSVENRKDIENNNTSAVEKKRSSAISKKSTTAATLKLPPDKKSALNGEIPPVKRENSAVDARIKILEKNLKSVSNTKSAALSKHSSDFEERLKEAIESVKD